MAEIKIGSWVKVRLRRACGGYSRVTPEHQDYLLYPVVRCRVSEVDICGVKGLYALQYEDGKPIGLPFTRRDFESVEG